MRGAPDVAPEVALRLVGAAASGRAGDGRGPRRHRVQALAARMCSASAANVASGTGSAEKTQGSAVQMPCPSKAWATSISVTLVT